MRAAPPPLVPKAVGTARARWYHPRPAPRCAADLAGFNYSYWLSIVVLVVLLLIPW